MTNTESTMETEVTTDPEQPASAADADPAPVVEDETSKPMDSSMSIERLDQRWIKLTRLVNLIWFGVIGLIALPVGLILIWFAAKPMPLIVLIVWGLLLASALLSIICWPRWEYNHWTYGLSSKVLELKFGVIWRVVVAIPLSRLQHVDLHRGPLERNQGLATLQIHTAGTRDASHSLPGLDIATANQLRDQLIDAANRGPRERTDD